MDDAAGDAFVGKKRADPSLRIDAAQRRIPHVPKRKAVLQRHERRVAAGDRLELRKQRLPLVRLERANDDVERSERSQIFAGVDACREPTEIALDLEAAVGNGAQVLAARDDRNLHARARECAGEKAADRAGTHDGYAHRCDEGMEATGRFELPNGAFAEPCLTTWLRRLTSCQRRYLSG